MGLGLSQALCVPFVCPLCSTGRDKSIPFPVCATASSARQTGIYHPLATPDSQECHNLQEHESQTPNKPPGLDLFPLLSPNGSLTNIKLIFPFCCRLPTWVQQRRSLGEGNSRSASQTGSIPAEIRNFMFARCSFGHPSLN